MTETTREQWEEKLRRSFEYHYSGVSGDPKEVAFHCFKWGYIEGMNRAAGIEATQHPKKTLAESK